jgi:ubiquinone biosynthesis protein UbiJ
MSREAALGVDSFILSLRTMFDERAAEGLEASYELRFGEDVFRAVVTDGSFEVERGAAEQPDAIVETDPATLAALVYDGRGTLAEALRSGEVKIEGEESVVERFLELFSLPEPAAAPAVDVGA